MRFVLITLAFVAFAQPAFSTDKFDEEKCTALAIQAAGDYRRAKGIRDAAFEIMGGAYMDASREKKEEFDNAMRFYRQIIEQVSNHANIYNAFCK